MARLTDIAKDWLTECIREGNHVIDATLGNGFDTLFLAQQVGASGHVFGFDVQQQALTATQTLLQHQPCQQSFFLSGHEAMAKHIPNALHGHIQAIMFNLGWLPNSDKNIITHADTTIAALEQSLALLSPSGRLSIMLYPGHQGGDTEAELVMTWLQATCSGETGFTLQKTTVANRPKAPILLQIQQEIV
ncbi:MAG: class I SAM-dependent methyltransferase [Ghiorsea sp.]|nr:class I SAM-dependent methyltransferase [Ghiorsea sp.]